MTTLPALKPTLPPKATKIPVQHVRSLIHVNDTEYYSFEKSSKQRRSVSSHVNAPHLFHGIAGVAQYRQDIYQRSNWIGPRVAMTSGWRIPRDAMTSLCIATMDRQDNPGFVWFGGLATMMSGFICSTLFLYIMIDETNKEEIMEFIEKCNKNREILCIYSRLSGFKQRVREWSG